MHPRFKILCYEKEIHDLQIKFCESWICFCFHFGPNLSGERFVLLKVHRYNKNIVVSGKRSCWEENGLFRKIVLRIEQDGGSRMKLIGINHITEEGERNVAVAVEYEKPLRADSVSREKFEVKGRRVLDVYASSRAEDTPERKSEDGRYVIIALDPAEKEAVTLPFEAQERLPLTYRVQQIRELEAVGGESISPWEASGMVTEVRNPVADRFRQQKYRDGQTGRTVAYSLYVPENREPGKKYPLVLYWHGGGEKGTNGLKSLLFSMNATIWSTEEEQKKQPCYILAPQCPPDADWIDPDTYKLTDVFDTICNLLMMILQKETIDLTRVYCIGFSMGGMGAWECTKRYPDLFAATMILAGQCNYEGLQVLKDNKIWIFHGEDDDKAMPGNMDNADTLEAAGARINRAVWDGSLRGEAAEALAEAQIGKGGNILHTLYREGSIKAGWTHEVGWRPAITNAGVRRWLMAQINEKPSNQVHAYVTKAQLTPVKVRFPFPGTELSQIAPGNRHTVALRKDGRVYTWGCNALGETNQAAEISLVSGLPGEIVQVAAGNNFSLALTKDGQVYGWGRDTFGQLNGEDSRAVYKEAILLKADHVTSIAAGDNYALALKEDGTVWGWGTNINGQLGQGNYQSSRNPVQVKDPQDATGYLTGVRKIYAGVRTAAAVKENGRAYCWGDGEYGQTGNGKAQHGPGVSLPVCCKASREGDELTGVKGIAEARCHTVVLTEEGSVYTWGLNKHGELGLGDHVPEVDLTDPANADFLTTEVYPQKVDGLEEIQEIAVGMSHTAVLKKDGTVWTWGYNDRMSRGALGIGDTEYSKVPMQVQGLADIERLYTGLNHNFAVDRTGTVWAWGNAENGRLGI